MYVTAYRYQPKKKEEQIVLSSKRKQTKPEQIVLMLTNCLFLLRTERCSATQTYTSVGDL